MKTSKPMELDELQTTLESLRIEIPEPLAIATLCFEPELPAPAFSFDGKQYRVHGPADLVGAINTVTQAWRDLLAIEKAAKDAEDEISDIIDAAKAKIRRPVKSAKLAAA